MEIVNQETEAIIELKLKVLINDKNGVVCEHKNYLNCIEDIEGGSYEKEYNKNQFSRSCSQCCRIYNIFQCGSVSCSN